MCSGCRSRIAGACSADGDVEKVRLLCGPTLVLVVVGPAAKHENDDVGLFALRRVDGPRGAPGMAGTVVTELVGDIAEWRAMRKSSMKSSL
jgi:hypothetical protein